ncbi:hypothetical protein ACFQAV_08325 [Companilactobacillus huachuanensis]|uniref:WxL domain-containing protein n=1 Tax=Companilactobacillus huachuanensis TaxID=2559914 RepID=A0ABW1RL47_9LACO|nr:hypothetical protein [Companilactobacillus huachuanensis]
MKNSNIFKKITLICFGIILLSNNHLTTKVYAADTNQDFQNALATTPKGLTWRDDDFTVADFAKAFENRKANGTNLGNNSNSLVTANASRVNNAKITQSTNPVNPNTSVIQMTNATWQTGAVWGNMTNDNYFDTTHEQIASMWIYFGKVSGVTPADGMAFVLHNDPNGDNAIALSKDGIPVNGQSLGVWGADWQVRNNQSDQLSKTAIQNSWALEFDTFTNFEARNITGEGNTFDNNILNIQRPDQHIAAGYPADPKTYTNGVGNYGRNYFTMNHSMDNYPSPYIFSSYNYPPTNLVDSAWHHITIKWTPVNDTSGNLSYAYNDKNPTTGAPLTPQAKESYNVNLTQLGITAENKKLYWGFTGSTGKNYQNNLIVFESIPSFVDADAKPAVYDDSQGGAEVTNSNTLVDPNSDIRYTYSLNYKGWTRTWDGINALMKVPNNVTFTSGTVTYPDSPNDKNPRPIPTEVFENVTNNQLEYLLPEGLDSHSRNAKIELKGHTIAKAPTQLTVPSVHASFEGDNLITGADTQAFKIRARLLSLESSSPNPITLKPHEDTNVPGKVTYIGSGSPPNYSRMNVYQTLNGITTNLGTIVDSTGNFNLPISADQLSKINTLSFYVTDSLGNTSNTISRQISVGGLLAFGYIQDTVFFKPTNGSFEDKIIPRLNNWQIDVVDSREKGSNWSVQANATNLTLNNNGKTPLKGNLIYREPSGKDHNLLNNTTGVATHTKDIEEPQTKNITDTWTNNSGILLSMKKGNPEGQYQGKINWILLDSLPNI